MAELPLGGDKLRQQWRRQDAAATAAGGRDTARRSCTGDLAALVGPLPRRRRGTLQPRGGCACPRRARGAEKKMKRRGKEARRPGPGRRRRRRRGAGNWVGGVERGRPNIDNVILMLEIGIPFLKEGEERTKSGQRFLKPKALFFFLFSIFFLLPPLFPRNSRKSLSRPVPLFSSLDLSRDRSRESPTNACVKVVLVRAAV